MLKLPGYVGIWFFLFITSSTDVKGQSFRVNVTGFSGHPFYNPYEYSITGPFGTETNNSGVFSVLSIPTSFSVEFRNGAISCVINGTVNNPLDYCATGFGGGPTASCGGGGSTASVSLGVTPIIAFETGTSSGVSSSISYCEYDEITLVGSPNFVGYHWQYEIEPGVWMNFISSTANSVTFGIQGIFGPNYNDYLNKTIYFRYYVGDCVNPSDAVGPYNFRPVPANVIALPPSNPLCYSGKGMLTVMNFSRDPVFQEDFRLTLKEASGNEKVIQQELGLTKTDLPKLFTGIPEGDYEVLLESFIPVPGSDPLEHISTGCGDPQPYTFTINIPSEVTISNQSSVPPTCHTTTSGVKNNGSITITAGGGTGSLCYSKDNWVTSQTGNVFTGLTVGSYTIKVKDGNGCETVSSPITVGEPPNITVNTPIITSDYNGRHISCVGSSNGQITIGATSTRTLTYSIDTGNNYQSSNVFNGLVAGDYSIIVKDDSELNGCLKTSSVVSVIAPPAIIGSASSTPTTCFEFSDGKIQIENQTGGTGTLSFSLSDDGVIQAGTLFTGRAANTYTATIRDANNCTKTINNITVSKPPAIAVTPTPTLVTCAGGKDGIVTLLASNTQGAVSYSLDAGALQPSPVFGNLSAAIHSYLVQDGNGCTSTGNVLVGSNAIITGPITVSTSISCHGGSNGALNLTPGGGVGPYTFAWSNSATSEDISGLSIGTYSVTITDTKNCQQTFNRTLTQPLPVTASVETSDFNGVGVSCFGGSNGSVDLTPAGGNGGYSYMWSNSSTTEDLTSLAAGMYSVTVTDSKGCTGNQTATVTQPAQLILSIDNSQNVSCFGGNNGSITLSSTGGITDYEYSINHGSSWQSTPSFTNLLANSYTVVSRDKNGCTDDEEVTLTSPEVLVLKTEGVNTTCGQINGSATASATGGASSYTFKWFNNSNTQISIGNSISDLSAGIYKVEVVDQNGCSKEQLIPISSSDGPAISVSQVIPTSCSNTSDGSATISITAGQVPYSIAWPDKQSTETAIHLEGGEYIVEVRDNSNCLSLQTVKIPAPDPLTIQTTNQKNPNCFGADDGAIEVTGLGGNGKYIYSWNTGSSSTTLTNLMAGIYTVTTTDIKNCQATQQFTLIEPPLFTINLGGDEKICEGQTVLKGTEINNATYAWTGPNNFTSNQQHASLTQPGVYTLSVKNQNGCEATDSFELSFDPALLKADFLMVSKAFAGDTILMIDISWPMPNSVSWRFDPAAVVLDESQDYSLIRFDDPGEYEVSIAAQLARCASFHSKTISVVENPNEKEGGRICSESIIRLVQVFPNPTSDKLTVEIELSEENEATVEIFHVQSSRRELSQVLKDESFYKQDFKVGHLQAGLYVVVVKVGNEMKSVRVIKL